MSHPRHVERARERLTDAIVAWEEVPDYEIGKFLEAWQTVEARIEELIKAATTGEEG